MTLNEKFEKWRTRTESLPIDERLAFRIFSDGYLDGAKAEREKERKLLKPLLEAVRESLHSDAHDLEADYMRLRKELALAYKSYLNRQ